MREKCFYVYKIICLCGEWKDKYYIGSHYGNINDNYTGSGKKIKEYFKLYGKRGTYTKEILDVADDEIYIKDKERKLITLYINEDNNLNIAKSAARTVLGRPLSDETKRKLSAANKGKKPSNEARMKMREAAKHKIMPPCSEETKQKISATKKRKAAQNAA